MPDAKIAAAPSECKTYKGYVPAVFAGAVNVKLVELIKVTTGATEVPIVIVGAPPTLLNPEPLIVIVSPPAVSVAVSVPGYVIEEILGATALVEVTVTPLFKAILPDR